MASLDQLNYLVNVICNPLTSYDTRAKAEQQLIDFERDENALGTYSNLLFQVDGTIFFFISMGLQRIVWRR